MTILEKPRKLKNSPNLLVLFVKITKFFEFSKKITIKTIVFSNSGIGMFRNMCEMVQNIGETQNKGTIHFMKGTPVTMDDCLWLLDTSQCCIVVIQRVKKRVRYTPLLDFFFHSFFFAFLSFFKY